ncbi:unnamed protein product, partial [Ectocarpus sp. 8 AP-2014]
RRGWQRDWDSAGRGGRERPCVSHVSVFAGARVLGAGGSGGCGGAVGGELRPGPAEPPRHGLPRPHLLLRLRLAGDDENKPQVETLRRTDPRAAPSPLARQLDPLRLHRTRNPLAGRRSSSGSSSTGRGSGE